MCYLIILTNKIEKTLDDQKINYSHIRIDNILYLSIEYIIFG